MVAEDAQDRCFEIPKKKKVIIKIGGVDFFCRQLYFPLQRFQVTAELYDFSGNDVLGFIKNLGSDLNTVMVFGHNHAFTYIANSLGNTYIDNVPTSGLVHLQFQVDDWSSVAKGTTKQTIFPKEIRG